MQISLKWVNELVNLETCNLNDLIDKLTLGGFEVEEVLEIDIDNRKTITLDISATANRSDSLSIQGLSLEIAALLNTTPKISNYSSPTYSWLNQIEKLESKHLIQKSCLGFITLTVENLTNLTSPKWLQQKLLASGITPENNLVDFQNYITLETGYPIELYDLEKINSNSNNQDIEFSLVTTDNSEIFLAHNEIEYKTNNSISILKANQLPISIAGIISSKNSHYSNTTKSLLVEGSIFNAATIRQQSRLLGLRTNRSSRYEKSLKNINLLDALYRFTLLLRIANPNLICKLQTYSQPVAEPIKTLELSYEKVKQVLGPTKKSITNTYEYISPTVITEALQRLQFSTIFDETNSKWTVSIPPLRSEDIVREIDLIEEIGRIYGFNQFLTRLPKIKTIGSEDFDYQVRKKLTSCFINIGLNELIQYSLVNKEIFLKNEVELINPLGNDYANLRVSLLPSLVTAVEENLKNSNSILEGFEYGHVFSNSSKAIVEETEYVAGIFGGLKIKSNWSDSVQVVSWFEAKGRIEELFKKLNINVYWRSYKPIKEKNLLHLYSSAEIYLTNGKRVGIFGRISPILAKKLNIDSHIYLFEFNFEVIKEQIKQNKLVVYKEYSFYPKIIKDLSFIVDKTISFNRIQEILYLNGSKFLKEINLLDEYRGKSIPQNKTSLCLQLIFQSELETLENNKVERILSSLTNVLVTNFDATIRI